MTFGSSDRSAGARLSSRLDLVALEERASRDVGRASGAVVLLTTVFLFAVVYMIGWWLNVPARKVLVADPGRTPQGPVIPVADPGRFGIAVDPGDRPDAAADAPAAAVPAEAPLLDQLAALLEAAAERHVAEVNPPGNGQGVPGGDIGRVLNDRRIGPDDEARQRSRRWVIEWGSDTEIGYRRKLDHFGIYLGAVRGGQLIGALRGFAG